MKSFAVIGLGRFGTQAAVSLYENGVEVLAIDKKEALINGIADNVTRAVAADAKNKDVLRQLGVGECDCVIIALGSDLAASVLITMNVKSLGVKQIICKAHDATHKEILEKLGADKVIIPEKDAAIKTAISLASPDFLHFIDYSDEFGIIELSPTKSWVGREIKDLHIRNNHNVNIIAIKNGDDMNVIVHADYKIQKNDTLVLLGSYESLEQVKKEEIFYRR